MGLTKIWLTFKWDNLVLSTELIMWNCHRKEIRRSEGLTSKRQLSNLFTVFQALISQLLKLCVLLRWSIMYSNWIIATNLAIWLANLPMSVRVQTTLLATMCHAMPFSARAYVSVKSKRQHAPPGNPPGIWLFWRLLFKLPPTRAKMPFKCPTLGSIQVIKCPHPGDISQAQKWQKNGGNAFSCRTKSLLI